MVLPSIFKIRSTIRNGWRCGSIFINSSMSIAPSAAGSGSGASLAGGGEKVCAARMGLLICSTIFRTSSHVARVAGPHGDDMAANRFAQQRQVADDVQHLVPHKFLAIPQRLGRQHRVVADDDGVFQAAALDQAVLEQKFNLFEKTKRPRVRQFLFPSLRRDFGGIKLREPPLLVRARAGDLEILVGKQRHGRLAMAGVQSVPSA